MARPSSTSSFEEQPLPRGFPWAFALAVGLMVAVEVALRLADPALSIPYCVPPFSPEHECEAVIDHVDAFGPADVCFAGSSRVHQGIVVPEVQAACDRLLPRRVFVANYAVAGARARHAHAIISYLLKNGKPELILYGVTPRIMLGSDFGPDRRVAMFWDIGEWWKRYQANRAETIRFLPILVRSVVSKRYLTLRYRRAVPTAIEGAVLAMGSSRDAPLSWADLLRGLRSPCPMRGETTYDHLHAPDQSLVTHPVPEHRARAFLDRTLKEGRYPMPEEHLGAIEDTIRLCQNHGVKIVFFELPISDFLREHLPPGVPEESRRRIQKVCDLSGVPFFTLDKLGLTFTDSDFLEYSHVNYHGALRITRALIDHAVIPMLKTTGDYGGT